MVGHINGMLPIRGGMPNFLTCSFASLHSATIILLSMSRWSIITSVNLNCSYSPSRVNLRRGGCVTVDMRVRLTWPCCRECLDHRRSARSWCLPRHHPRQRHRHHQKHQLVWEWSMSLILIYLRRWPSSCPAWWVWAWCWTWSSCGPRRCPPFVSPRTVHPPSSSASLSGSFYESSDPPNFLNNWHLTVNNWQWVTQVTHKVETTLLGLTSVSQLCCHNFKLYKPWWIALFCQ